MKKLISFVLIGCLFSNLSFGACDWSTIKKLPDGGYEYSSDLNLCVGQLVQDSKVKDQQIADLNQAIQLKDLALTKSDARVLLWTTTAENEQDRLAKLNADQKKSDWLYFGLGVLTTFAAGYTAASLARH